MRAGELFSLKNTTQQNLFSQLIKLLCLGGASRRNYKFLSELICNIKSTFNQDPYRCMLNTIDKLVLRLRLLEATQRGKKISVPLPVSKNLAVSLFIQKLVLTLRKNDVYHKDLASTISTLLEEATQKKGFLYSSKRRAYFTARQNRYTTRWFYIVKGHKKRNIKKRIIL